jgi:hypothetical protein
VRALKALREVFESCGYPFELEERLRFRAGRALVEVGEGEGVLVVETSVPLPSTSSTEEEYLGASEVFRDAMTFLSRLRGRVSYEVDLSLPDYPTLRIVKVVEGVGELVEGIRSYLKYSGSCVEGVGPEEP